MVVFFVALFLGSILWLLEKKKAAITLVFLCFAGAACDFGLRVAKEFLSRGA